jgi:putative ABC transport system permease protein
VVWFLESAVLGVLGGVSGLVLTSAFHRLLPLVLPPNFPRGHDVTFDARVALFAIGLTCSASLVCGLLPALQSRHPAHAMSLAGEGLAWRLAGTPLRGVRLGAVMMMAQVAIACLLLVGTGLLMRTFATLLSADRGFDPRNVLTVHATTQARPFTSRSASLERAQARLGSLPGVTHVALGNALPFVTIGGMHGMKLPSPNDPGTTMQVQTLMRVVSPEYFAAMGLRVVAGRALDRTDTSTSRPVVVANKTFAARYLGSSPLGTVLPALIASREQWDVVGVVDDVRQGGLRGVAPAPFGGLTDPPQPELFFTYRQWDVNVNELVYVIRSAVDPVRLAPIVRTILREEEPSLTVESIMTMEDRVMESLARPRTYAMLVAGFALFAAAVAVVGLFGVLTHMATQRTREIGVRSALGARPPDILRLVTREAAAITVSGIVVGLIAAFTLSRWLSTLLFGVTTHDAATFVAVPVLLLVAAAAACAVPAWRAARMSPLVALRS